MQQHVATAEKAPEAPILLVDDDAKVRDAMKSLLELDGYSVVSARDGEDAMQQLKKGLSPCIILLDLVMPRKNGFQFRAEQLQDPTLAPIPVVVYSGQYDVQSQHQSTLGAAAYLQKPVNVRSLLDTVAHYCRRPDAG